MVSRPSVVFLFDTELILDGKFKESTTSEVNNVSCADLIRQVTFSILNNFYDKQNGTQWGYRFYTSSSYRLTNKTRFFDLSLQTLDEFEDSVNLNFEQRSDLLRDSANQTLSKASVLSRALQDIVSDYDWKTPSDSLTPTRKGRKPGKNVAQESNQNQNLVFIFTEIPADGMLQDFCQLKSQQEVTLKAVTDAIFSKELVKRFHEFSISLNFIDFSENEKHLFSQLISNLNGAVLQAKAFLSPFSFQHVLQASHLLSKPLKGSANHCDHLDNFNISVQYTSSANLEFEAFCADNFCLQSYRKVNSLVVTPCVGAYGSLLPSPDMLAYSSVVFLVSKFPMPKSFQQYTWVGKLEKMCVISPISRHVASLFLLPECSWLSLSALFNGQDLTDIDKNVDAGGDSEIKTFVDHLMNEEGYTSADPYVLSEDDVFARGDILKSHFVEKKRRFSSFHWDLLKNCFEKDTGIEATTAEQTNQCLDKLRMQPIAQNDVSTGTNDVLMKKLGNNRSQNLRASTLLLKSQEMRAKHDEMEREKSTRERKVLLEKKEKSIKEHQTNMQSLRDSILPTNELIQLTPATISYQKEEILEKCTALKSEGISSQLDDAQLQSLSQVIVSTILYVWKEPNSMDAAYEVIIKNFLRKPGFINRSVPKESKVLEFKLQIFFRLELFWIAPPSLGDEDEVLQDTIPFFQMLSIHSSPQSMASFYQDSVVQNFECMTPQLLISIGEELNQPIPASLLDQVESKPDATSPSPSVGSKVPSVRSVASLQENPDSQNASKEPRARMLTRHSSFNVQHRKQIALPKREERNSMPIKRDEPNEVVRVRRSLQFGGEAPPAAEQSCLTSLVPKPEVLPDQSHLFATPSKSNKLILAPETPSRLRSGTKSNRKTDGVCVVGESPDVKSENIRRSPRRLEAAMALRRRASFYSTLSSDVNVDKNTSRNWARAESQVWSEKAKSAVTMPTALTTSEDNNIASQSHSARFLFSRILSCTDSVNNDGAFESPKKTMEADSQNGIPSLATPRKTERVPSTPSRRNVNPLDSEEIQQIAGTPLKTPLKTPKHVQFNLIHQPATPSSKMAPDPRSILKSPLVPSSPGLKKTPKKNAVLNNLQNFSHHHNSGLDNSDEMDGLEKYHQHTDELENSHQHSDGQENSMHVMNSTGSSSAEEPIKESSNMQRTQEDTAPKPNRKSIVSPLILRRSPRHRGQTTNFYNHDPNWSVVNYRRLTTSRGEKAFKSPDNSQKKQADPYEFDEPMDTKPSRSTVNDFTTHKRKLFQSSNESPMAKKSRFLSPSKTGDPKSFQFQGPSEGSLFHLENSPLVAARDRKY